jgi:hypothetical protein
LRLQSAFQLALEYVIRKVQENRGGIKIIGTHQLLAYADDVNLLEDNTDIIKKNTETVSDASKKLGLEVNAERTKYMFLYCHQKAWQNHKMKTANRSLEDVEYF